jgi:hypothetical protein
LVLQRSVSQAAEALLAVLLPVQSSGLTVLQFAIHLA